MRSNSSGPDPRRLPGSGRDVLPGLPEQLVGVTADPDGRIASLYTLLLND